MFVAALVPTLLGGCSSAAPAPSALTVAIPAASDDVVVSGDLADLPGPMGSSHWLCALVVAACLWAG
jgi:3',5'-cyclic AMP phosphodiesterase CpdA